jgi:hypothetical protein
MNRKTLKSSILTLILALVALPATVVGAERPTGSTGGSGGFGEPEPPANLAEQPPEAPADETPALTVPDFDGDGSLDPVDNCLAHGNSQRDADRDGFGNRCDPDFDNDGDVDDEDMATLQRVLDEGPAVAFDERLMDLDEDGDVDDEDMTILREFLGGAPGPVRDTDNDLTPDARDVCPGTPSFSTALSSGCSALDTFQSPHGLTDPVAAEITELADLLGGDPLYDEVVSNLDAAVVSLGDAAQAVADGEPCGADGPLADAQGYLGAAKNAMALLVESAEADTPPMDRSLGDAQPEDMTLLHRKFEEQQIDDAIADTTDVQDSFQSVCASAQPWSGRGVISEVDDLRRRFVMEDGSLVGFARFADADAAPGPGMEINIVDGFHFGNGAYYGDELAAESAQPNLTVTPCARLRFAPIQKFGDWGGGPPYTLLLPDAYELNGKYRIEEDMRFGAAYVCSGGGQIQTTFPKYSLKLTALYWYTPSQTNPLAEVIAADLDSTDEPVPLPDKYWNKNTYDRVTLKVETLKRTCSILGLNQMSCSNPQMILEEQFPLDRRDRGSQCVLSYANTEFDIDDQVAGSWDQTWITNVVFTFPTTTTEHFEAMGYEMCNNGGWAPCTGVSTIYAPNHSFTLKSHDFYTVPFVPDPNSQEILYQITGVERAAGLMWPRLYGTNNGKQWQFSCKVPRVTRDYVDFCPGGTDSMYRLPFVHSEHGTWVCGQGNMSPGANDSHNGAFALDMNDQDGGCGDKLRASRAGTVTQVVENRSCMNHPNCSTWNPNCGSLCCTQSEVNAGMQWGNFVRVRHMDDSVGLYLHLMPNGAAVQVGDIVKRGELIGWVGTTGRSSGPHVHWESEDLNGVGHLSLYEATNPSNFTPMTCYEPQTGHTLRSTNKAQ